MAGKPEVLVARKGRFGSVTYSREGPLPPDTGGGLSSLLMASAQKVCENGWTVIGAGSLDAEDRDFEFVVIGWTENNAKMDVRLHDLGSGEVSTVAIQSDITVRISSGKLALGEGLRLYEVRARIGGEGFVAGAFLEVVE